MGTITVTIKDETEERLREFLWKKYRGKGHTMGSTIDQAINEFLNLHESEVESE